MAGMELVILILLTIVVIGVVNEKWIHLQSDIALVLFSVAICAVLLILSRIPGMEGLGEKLKELGSFDFEKYLMDFCITVPDKCYYDDEVEAFGGRIFRIPPK